MPILNRPYWLDCAGSAKPRGSGGYRAIGPVLAPTGPA